MIKKIGDPVEGDGCLAAPGPTLDHQDPVLCIADDRILFFLDRPHDVFQSDIPVLAQFLLQDLIVDLRIALKSIDHLSATDLILPLGRDLTLDHSCRGFIGRRPLVKIIEKAADRRSPVVNKRRHPRFFCEIANPDIERLRCILPVKNKIHPAEERRILHALVPVLHPQFLRICIRLLQKRLLIIIILVSVLVHFRIIVPVVLVHIFNFFLPFTEIPADLIKSFFYLKSYIFQKCISVIIYIFSCHNPLLRSVPHNCHFNSISCIFPKGITK